MSDTSTLLANPKSFSHNGKEYTVSLITQKVKAQYEDWLKAQALSLLLDLKAHVDPGEWSEHFASHKEEVTSGHYSFHGSLAQKTLRTPVGSLKLGSLLFGVSEDEMANLVMAKPGEVKALLESVAVESFPFETQEKN